MTGLAITQTAPITSATESEKVTMSGSKPSFVATQTDVCNDNEGSSRETFGQVEAIETSDPKLLRRIDWHIVPLCFASYFLQFLDKVILNYANITGISKDLHMVGNDFAWLATGFFIAYAVAEIPQGMLLQRFPLTKVLGFNILLWGITIACSSAAQNYGGLLACRILLGITEAVISPALTMITAQWYTKREAGPRYGLWFCGLGVGQIIGGLISFGAQHGARGDTFGGWRIMFLCVGIFNIMIAICVLLFLPDNVASAKFISESDKAAIHLKLSLDQAGNGAKVFRLAGLGEVFMDAQVWLMMLLTTLTVIPSGVVSTFSATIIRGFGYNSKTAALLNMPSGIVSIAATMLSTWSILKGFPRWISLILVLIPSVIGGALMAFAPAHNLGARLTGIYLINFIVAPLAIIFSWISGNTAGYTKRVAANGLIAIAFGIGNIIGPQTFQAHDAPRYIPAAVTILAVSGGGIVVAAALRLLYGFRNKNSVKRRAQHMQEVGQQGLAQEELEDNRTRTDLKDPEFVYVY